MWERRGGKDELHLKISIKSPHKKKHLSCKEWGRKIAGVKSKKQVVFGSGESSM